MEIIKEYIKNIYPEQYEKVYADVNSLIDKWKSKDFKDYPWINQNDVVLITYGDAIFNENEKSLETLAKFLKNYAKECINIVHLLPICPYTSDDGFSVVDFRQVDQKLGDWEDVKNLGEDFDLMLDAVINHVSKSSVYFQEFLNSNPKYKNFFIEADPSLDYSKVTRPRTLPLLTEFQTKDGISNIWTTFSDDQIDLNYKEPQVLLEVLDILLFYAEMGARFTRLDAVGFIWKELESSCMHLPQTHEIIKLARAVINACAPGANIITETNVAHKENISYFGNGYDEAALVYQFPLPPLTLYSFITGNAEKLTDWAMSLEETTSATSFFNFLASHDGIGLRPTEGILSDDDRNLLLEETQRKGGLIGWRNLPDGSKTAYELNINYMDAISEPEDADEERCKKTLAAHAILLSLAGMPAIYYHSLFGSRNNRKEAIESGINRRINREKLEFDTLVKECNTEGSLRNIVFEGIKNMLKVRRNNPAFSPNAKQEILKLDKRLFALKRGEKNKVLTIINVSAENVEIEKEIQGINLITGKKINGNLKLEPYEFYWIQIEEE